MADKIKLRRDTLANWEAVNPILDEGELGVITDSNAIVIGDGVTGFKNLQEIPNQQPPNEYFNIYKHSKLLFESTTSQPFYGLPHFLITNLNDFKQYIIARRANAHEPEPAQLTKIEIATKLETILYDGISTNTELRDGFVFYYNNIPYLITLETSIISSVVTPVRIIVMNPLDGTIINENSSLNLQFTSYIIFENEIYFHAYNSSHNQKIIKYSPELNTFTVLSSWQSNYLEAEGSIGKINGKFFVITRSYDPAAPSTFSLYLLDNDFSIKKHIFFDLGIHFNITTPYIFRKGNKIIFTFLTRIANQTPGLLFTYEIIENNDNFSFNLKNVHSPLLKEDMFHHTADNGIAQTGYQIPTILPYFKAGLLLTEDHRTVPEYKTRLYQIEYDNDISVDYSNF